MVDFSHVRFYWRGTGIYINANLLPHEPMQIMQMLYNEWADLERRRRYDEELTTYPVSDLNTPTTKAWMLNTTVYLKRSFSFEDFNRLKDTLVESQTWFSVERDSYTFYKVLPSGLVKWVDFEGNVIGNMNRRIYT